MKTGPGGGQGTPDRLHRRRGLCYLGIEKLLITIVYRKDVKAAKKKRVGILSGQSFAILAPLR